MGLFNKFPYTNFHELNLDFIISQIPILRQYTEDAKTARDEAQEAQEGAETAESGAQSLYEATSTEHSEAVKEIRSAELHLSEYTSERVSELGSIATSEKSEFSSLATSEKANITSLISSEKSEFSSLATSEKANITSLATSEKSEFSSLASTEQQNLKGSATTYANSLKSNANRYESDLNEQWLSERVDLGSEGGKYLESMSVIASTVDSTGSTYTSELTSTFTSGSTVESVATSEINSQYTEIKSEMDAFSNNLDYYVGGKRNITTTSSIATAESLLEFLKDPTPNGGTGIITLASDMLGLPAGGYTYTELVLDNYSGTTDGLYRVILLTSKLYLKNYILSIGKDDTYLVQAVGGTPYKSYYDGSQNVYKVEDYTYIWQYIMRGPGEYYIQVQNTTSGMFNAGLYRMVVQKSILDSIMYTAILEEVNPDNGYTYGVNTYYTIINNQGGSGGYYHVGETYKAVPNFKPRDTAITELCSATGADSTMSTVKIYGGHDTLNTIGFIGSTTQNVGYTMYIQLAGSTGLSAGVHTIYSFLNDVPAGIAPCVVMCSQAVGNTIAYGSYEPNMNALTIFIPEDVGNIVMLYGSAPINCREY